MDMTNGSPMRRNRRVVDGATVGQRRTTTAVDVDTEAEIVPIMGYAEEPLLPLAEACAPLVSIVYNLMFYVQQALNETPKAPSDGLTVDESASIRLYTIEWEEPYRSVYSMLNSNLETGDRSDLRPYFKFLKLLLTALTKVPCVPQRTVWRGITQDLSDNFPCGESVIWWKFSSCTTTMTVLNNNMYLGDQGPRTLFSIEAINGRMIRGHSHFVDEDEILLLPGTQMVVQSKLSPAPDLHIIHLKQMVPEKPLVELPFEGILKTFYFLF